MSDSFQDVYAKHLQHAASAYGYPLRMPEPMNTLPQNYQDSGLEIGDVGIVDNRGQFDVLFNICKRSDNSLHDLRGVPKGFQPIQYNTIEIKASDSENAISAGPIFSHGIKQILQPKEPRSADYEFDSSTRAGAILILPHGATSAELSSVQRFREVAVKNALDWYEFANQCCDVQHRDRTLYLITGFYKARSWCLGSFNNPTNTPGKILARRDDTNPSIYRLECAFPADRRASKDVDSGNINQTVFITGFKITVGSWLPDPIVLRVTETETIFSKLFRLFKACLNQLYGFSGSHKQHAPISVEHSSQLTQPFHPSDIINRFLLNKKPNAEVAITHDNQWMGMMKEGLTHEDLLQDDRLETFLMRYYTISFDSERENAAVFLQGKADDTTDSIPPTVGSHDISSELELSPPPTPSFDNPRIVITRVRAHNICSVLRRIPVGFYVLVQFDAAQRRTQNKSIQLNEHSIEWEDVILLPSEAFGKVRFTVYATFELEPMLGNGEALYSSESRLEELIGGTYLITFSPGALGTAASDPSLLLTLGRWYSNHLIVAPSGDNSNVIRPLYTDAHWLTTRYRQLDSEESSVLVPESCLGQEALLRYYNEYQREDFEKAIQHFECAWRNCPLTHPCRAVVLVNLAKTKFISYQTDPTSGNLDESIQLYRQALDLRPPGHLDRSATLLQLAQTLFLRYEKEGCNESDADEINDLITKPKPFPDDTHERQAADLMLETLERCRVVNSGSMAELNQLIRKLEQSIMVPPDGYFDIPQRLINLSTALWRRCKTHGEPGDLDHLLDVCKQALQLLPVRHPDRLPVLKTLGAVLRRLFEIRGDLSYLEQLIAPSEEALQLVPEGHPERSHWVTNSTSYDTEMSERSKKYDKVIDSSSPTHKMSSSRKQVRFNDDNIFYSPKSTPPPTLPPTPQFRFNDDNIFYSPKSTPPPTLPPTPPPTPCELSFPSGDSSGPCTPPQNDHASLPLPDGPIAIHPLLAFHPFVPPIIYDASLPPHTLARNMKASPMSLSDRVLEEPATQPSMHTMMLVIEEFPWRLTIPPTKHFVSVRDILEALYCFLRHPVLPSEYNTLPTQTLKDEVAIAFHNRCGRAPSKEAADEQYQKGVKRVDFLRGRTQFMGLSSTKVGPDMWVLNLA